MLLDYTNIFKTILIGWTFILMCQTFYVIYNIGYIEFVLVSWYLFLTRIYHSDWLQNFNRRISNGNELVPCNISI